MSIDASPTLRVAVGALVGRVLLPHPVLAPGSPVWRFEVVVPARGDAMAGRDSFECVGIGVITADENGTIVGFDSGAAEIFGLSAAAVLGQNLAVLMPDAVAAEHAGSMAQFQATGERRAVGSGRRVTGRRHDGTLFPLELVLSEIRAGDRRVSIAVVRDVGMREEFARTLRLRERAVDAVANGVTVVDARAEDMPIIFANPAFERITGFPSVEVVGRNCRFLHRGDDMQPALDELRAAIAAGRACKVLLCNYRKNGTMFWNELSISPLLDDEGRVSHFVGVQNDVTDKVLAERAQQESDTRFRLLAENSSDMISRHARDGACLYSSPAARLLLGYEPEEMLGVCFADLAHPDDLESVRAGFASAIDSPGTQVLTWRIRTRDGRFLWLETTLRGVRTASTLEVNEVQSTSRDVSDRKVAEDALVRNEARFRSLIERSTDMITLLDGAGTIVYSSPSALNVSGRGIEESEGRNGFLNIHPEDAKRVREVFARSIQGSGPVSTRLEFRLRHADGTWRTLEAVATNLLDDPNVRAVVVNSRDITDRRQAEAALRASEGRSRALVEAIPDTLVVIDRQGRVVDVKNDPATGLPLPAGTLAGKRAEDILPLEFAGVLRRHLEALLASGEPQGFDVALPVSNGVQDYEVRLVGLGEEQVLVLVRNSTERRQVERLKSEFVSVVSHELRTPLTSIRGSLGLLGSGVIGELPAQARQLIEIATANSERLVRLINDILDIDKIESGQMSFKMGPADLVEIVRGTVDANRALGEAAGIKLVVELPPSPGRVEVSADSGRIAQVLANLLSNAVKFSPRDGRVTVRVAAQDGVARVEVSDRGPGIPAEFQARVFQRFAQADSSAIRQKGGTGLGLAISKAIIERHHGRLSFHSVPGEGATFFFVLPLRVAPEAAVDEVVTRPRVLVCEDNPDIGGLIALLLDDGGFEAIVAPSAAAANLALDHGVFAAMTLDLGLPDVDGLTFLSQLRARRGDLKPPVVVVSARGPRDLVLKEDHPLGIADWLEKPVSGARLLDAIAAAVECNQDAVQEGERP